jgi:transposase
MTPREERGLVIAALCKLNKNGDSWLVPSQSSGERTYRVDPVKQTCTCPDHQEAGHKCKHLFAVEITMKRECHADGTIIETRSVTMTERKTYKQDWPAYNLAQTTEKHRFQKLLFDLCQGVQQPERADRKKGGRPRVPISDVLFAVGMKVYGTLSARRSMCDLKDAFERGYMTRSIHFNSICGYLESEEITPILKALIAVSAQPLRAVDHDFAVDSTGFTSSKFVRWYDHKYGVTRQSHTWVKSHFCTGVKSNIVTAVRILDRDAADSPQFAPLVRETAKSFTIAEVSADKAYGSLENFETVANCGGEAFIAFKKNATGAVGGLFAKMLAYYQFRQEEFLQHYHKRSNVESTVSMVKRKFGDHVRSRTDVAAVNEVLGKFLVHNICVVIASQCELGIEPIFWPEEADAGDGPVVLPMIRHD